MPATGPSHSASAAARSVLTWLATPPAPVKHERQAVRDGTPLEVKSQKLSQPGPKVYPSGLTKETQDAGRRVVVDVKAQRAWLFVAGRLAFETPVSTGTKGRRTPCGTFTITEKMRQGKRSTLYKSPMPFWNRLDESAIGLHTGNLPGYPASHGCIRLPGESARFLFDHAPKGTRVEIVESLPAAPAPVTGGELIAAAQ